MLATSQDPKLRSIANPEKQRIIEAFNKLEVPIEPGDFNNPSLLTMVTDGMVEYKGNQSLRYMLQSMAHEGIIVAYYCDNAPRREYEGLAYVNWSLWEEWITEDPTISQLRETFTAKT
jgi:hypothetical protein